MFLTAPGNPTQAKHVVYLIASIVLGLLLSLLLHAAIEGTYLWYAGRQGIIVIFTSGGCALPVWFQSALWLLGAVGGFLLGRFWWRYVYVDRIWAKRVGATNPE